MSSSTKNTRVAFGRWTPIIAISLLLLVDGTFDCYFWRIPKPTGAWTDFSYEFLSTVQRLKAGKSEHAVRVVAVGSSLVASFDPHQVANLIETQNPARPLDVERLLLAGAKPSDYRLIFDAEGEAIDPDVVVLALNLVDFLNPSFEANLKAQVRYVLPPWQTLVERRAFVGGVSGQLDLLLASGSRLYRYRKVIRSCIQDYVKLALSQLGGHPRAVGYGLYADGYARQRFGLPLDALRGQALEYYVDPQWIHQQGRVHMEFSLDGRRLAEQDVVESGWKRVAIAVPTAPAGVLDVAADSAWTPRAGGLDGDVRRLSVRLAQPVPPSAIYDGEPGFLRMGGRVGREFADYWWQTISGDTPFAEEMRGYQREQLKIRKATFERRGEYAETERLVANFARRGTAVVVVNSPESPLILSEYQDTPYYRAHLEFLRELAEKYPGVRFYDLSSALPAEDFNDWHHVNYVGTIKLGPRYAEFVSQALATRLAVGH